MTEHSEMLRPLYYFARGYDDDDFDLFADSLTEDAVVIFHPDDPNRPDGRAEGRDAIREHFDELRSRRRHQQVQPRHFVLNTIIDEESENEVMARSYFIASISTEGSVSVDATGCYIDRLVKENGRWRIRERIVAENDTGKFTGVQSHVRKAG